MLRREYIKKIWPNDCACFGKELTEEEMKAVFPVGTGLIERLLGDDAVGGDGVSIRPVFSLKEVIDKAGRRRIVPYFGIEGKF